MLGCLLLLQQDVGECALPDFFVSRSVEFRAADGLIACASFGAVSHGSGRLRGDFEEAMIRLDLRYFEYLSLKVHVPGDVVANNVVD